MFVNVNTIDGHSTFHSMGGIACVTPSGTEETDIPVPCILNIPSAEMVGSYGKIPFKTYKNPSIQNHLIQPEN